MYEQLIHIRIFQKREYFDVWIANTYDVDDFIEDIKDRVFVNKYVYKHFLFHLENNRILDGGKSFEQNNVIQGDHLILF